MGPERRAFHDVCADTTVVCRWDAHGVRLRALANRHAAKRAAHP